MTSHPRLRLSGDGLLLVEFEARLDASINAVVLAVADRLTAQAMPGVRDVVPAYASIGVHLDPLRADLSAIEQAILQACDGCAVALRTDGGASQTGRLVEVPVWYGGAAGPDLAEVASRTGLDEDAVIAAHTAAEYRVFMLGFVPGFAYMASVDPRLRLPRRDAPRQQVPAGSVAVAGEQTGIYPAVTPGGWHLLGRTPWRLFDHTAESPSRLRPGDRVRFTPVDAASFEMLARREAHR